MTATEGAIERGAASPLLDVARIAPELSAAFLEQHAVLPLRRESGRVVVATWRDHVDDQTLDDLRLLFDLDVELLRLGEQELRASIHRIYADGGASAEDLIATFAQEGAATDKEIPLDDLVSLANEAPVVRLVNLLLLEALEARASDVHIEGYARNLRVRYRIDGVLRDVPSPPVQLMPAVISRLKIMAELDIAERRVPQDGRIRLRLQDRQVDVRVSTLPTLHGESIVLRLLDSESGRVGLEQLGMSTATLAQFVDVISRPHGIVLATGPTGSGKTTTLYAAIDRIRTGREKILTVEDPVEYELAGVPQVPVNEKVGVTFATALRALLRQDPDIILVGEIRDAETAEIATQAALTGHLVLSTLHTNDAPSALTRLLELGIAPYLATSTVDAILAQRLVRTVCRDCREEVPIGHTRAADDAIPTTEWRGRGCERCSDTGYRGRTGIYELLTVDESLRGELMRRGGATDLRRIARASGMQTLYEDGLRHVRAGVTTLEEVLRVTRA